MAISRFLFCVAAGVVWCGAAGAQQFTITTVVGTGVPGSSGDSGAATAATLAIPDGVSLDSSGKLYIADSGNHKVRVVSGGTITTIAGTGTAGSSGDGKAATAAQLSGPASVVVDSSGNVYIADTGNHLIRKIASGNISTIAGSGTGAGYAGDLGVATNSQLFSPTGLALDSAGNLYIADTGNNVIRFVSGGNISTIVGGATTQTQLNHPTGLALDGSGNLYIADTGNRRIVKFSGGTITTVPVVSSTGVTSNVATISGGTVTAIAGNGTSLFSGDNGPALKAGINDPTGVTVDKAGNIYITDNFNSRIRRITPDGIITTVAGNGRAAYSGDSGPAIAAALNFPHGLVADSSGNLYVADSSNSVIRFLQTQSPSISANGVVNAGSFTPSLSAGSLASIFGGNFASANASATLPLQTTLGGIKVTVNGRAAPILFVSSGQINFQVPWETTNGPAQVVVNNGISSNTATVNIITAAPGLFLLAGGHAVVQNSDFSLNGPNNPAKPGGTIVAYLTGSGPVSPAVATGAVSPTSPLAQITSTTSATIGSTPAAVSFAGLTPNFVSLVQMNIIVPASLAPGEYPLVVTINGQASNSGTVSVGK